MRNIGVDAGFFIALYDESEDHHQQAMGIFETHVLAPTALIIVPWPVMYEIIRTRMARRREIMIRFKHNWMSLRKQNKLKKIDDSPYREEALVETLKEVERGSNYRPLSLVDRVIRSMLAEKKLRFSAFITFNPGDFADIARTRAIELLPSPRT